MKILIQNGTLVTPDGMKKGDLLVEGGKIAALGLKIHRQCSYHGVALNVAMDLAPYARIHPCGYQTLQATDLAACGVRASWDDAAWRLGQALARRLTA